MNISIEKATENDYQVVADLVNHAYSVAYKEGGLITRPNDSPERIKKEVENGSKIYIAKSGDKAVATVRLEPLDKARVRLLRLAVRPENRRNGIGVQLIEFCSNQAKKQGYKYIQIDIAKEKGIANYYQKLGFYPIKETPLVDYTEIIMRKDI
jgi:predicted N-acetyltransferase YhbS